jgi:hypothetical protein
MCVKSADESMHLLKHRVGKNRDRIGKVRSRLVSEEKDFKSLLSQSSGKCTTGRVATEHEDTSQFPVPGQGAAVEEHGFKCRNVQ